MQKVYPMTVDGEQQLQNELIKLKQIERPNIIMAIAEARSFGDLSENAEYDAAKNKQSFIEGKIQEIEHKLQFAQIIDIKKITNDGYIVFGATVYLFDLEQNANIVYKIVGDDEADLKHNKISINSPVARGLIGKKIGDIIEIKVPSGSKEYEILNFLF